MAKEIATKTKLDTRIAADIAAAMPVANQPAAVKTAAAPALAKKAIVIDTEEVQAAVEQAVEGSADVIVAQAAGAATSGAAAGGAAAAGMSTTALVVAGVAVAAAASSSSSSATPAAATTPTTPTTPATPVGKSFDLTSKTDTILGTAGKDTVTGTVGNVADADLIIDDTAGDGDTATLTLNADYTPTNITKIENVNLVWDAFAAPTINLTGVTGADAVKISSSKVGYLGSATVTNATGLALTASDGIVGTFTASGFKTGSVTAPNAATIVVNGSTTNSNNESITVTAGAATSVTVGTTNGWKAATIDAGKATTIAIKDTTSGTSDTIALTVNANATITNTGSTGALTINASDKNSLTLNDIGASLTVKGTGTVTLNSTGLDGETVTNSVTGALNIKTSSTGALNLSKVQASLIEFSGVKAGADTVVNGSNLKYTAAGGAINVTVSGTGTNDAVTAEVTAATAASITSTGVETLTINANATQVSGADLTVTSLATGGNTIKLTGTNDVAITNIGLTGETKGVIDASKLVGTLTVGIDTTADSETFAVIGGSDKLSITTATVSGNQTFTGTAKDDSVTANAVTTGSVTALLGEGANTVSATALTTGALVVTGGAGVDTVTAGAALTTGSINLNLGDGANVVNLDDAAGAGTRVITTGSGDDLLQFTEGVDDAADVINWTAGAGTDTFFLVTEAADISAAGSKISLSGVEIVKVKAESQAEAARLSYEAVFSASQLSGQTLTIKADAYAAGKATDIKVVGSATTSTIDLSGITLDNSLTGAISSAAIDAALNLTTAVTITGTSGDDFITGGSKDDVINAGKGADIITGGAGNDIINITEATADSAIDNIVMTGQATNGKDTITGFKVGTDTVTLSLTDAGGTNGQNAGNAVVVADLATALTSGAAAFNIASSIAVTDDIVEISTALSSNGNLDLATDGTEVLKALSSTSAAATQITTDADHKGYFMFYQNSKAYLYYADADSAGTTDTAIVASEMKLLAVFEGITAGTFVAGSFLVA